MTSSEQPNPHDGEQFKPAFTPEHPDETGEDFDRKELDAPDEPHYLDYWADRIAEWEDTDPSRAELAAHRHEMLHALTETVIRGDGRVEGDDRYMITRHYQTQQWLHMLGPESGLEGAAPDLEAAGDILLGGLEEAGSRDGDVEFSKLEACGAFVMAARSAETYEERQRIRSKARRTLNDTLTHAPTEWQGEVGAHMSDLFMLYQELDYDQVYDDFEQTGQDVSTREGTMALVTKIAEKHFGHIRVFKDRIGEPGEKPTLPNGKVYEWFFGLVHRHKKLIKGDFDYFAHTRLRSTTPNEDAPFDPRGMRDVLSDGRDYVEEVTDDEGVTRIAARLQLKSYNPRAKREERRNYTIQEERYRPPVVEVVVEDGDLQKGRELRELMRQTALDMVASTTKGAPQSLESFDRAVDVTGFPKAG